MATKNEDVLNHQNEGVLHHQNESVTQGNIFTTATALTLLYHHVDSLGHYGPTALITPMYVIVEYSVV